MQGMNNCMISKYTYKCLPLHVYLIALYTSWIVHAPIKNHRFTDAWLNVVLACVFMGSVLSIVAINLVNVSIYWFGDPACWSFADVLLSVDGCSAKCGVKVHQLLEFDVLSYHHYFTQLTKSAKQQWMLDYFRTHSSMNETTYMKGGKTVRRFG